MYDSVAVVTIHPYDLLDLFDSFDSCDLFGIHTYIYMHMYMFVDISLKSRVLVA